MNREEYDKYWEYQMSVENLKKADIKEMSYKDKDLSFGAEFFVACYYHKDFITLKNEVGYNSKTKERIIINDWDENMGRIKKRATKKFPIKKSVKGGKKK